MDLSLITSTQDHVNPVLHFIVSHGKSDLVPQHMWVNQPHFEHLMHANYPSPHPHLALATFTSSPAHLLCIHVFCPTL